MNYAKQFPGAPVRHHDPFAIPSVVILVAGVALLAAVSIVVLIVGMAAA